MNTDAIKIEYGTNEYLEAEDFMDDGFVLEENLCSESQIAFGACEAAAVEVSIASTAASFVGKELKPFLGNGQLGIYKAVSDERASDGETRNIKAYDKLYDVNGMDVSAWYNAIDWTQVTTLKQFRDSFFNHIGLAQENVTLPNDSMNVKSTIDTQSLSGAAVLKAICEINGAFGHINLLGRFQYVFLPENTAPATGIDVDEVLDTTTEDFTVAAFDSVLIRTEEGDIGAQYPATGGDNQYIITGNFLCYGKGAEELQTIAQRAATKICNRAYVHFDAELECQNTVQLGGRVTIPTELGTFTSYVLQRRLVGIDALTEYYGAKGTPEYTPNVNSARNQMIATSQRINKLTTTLDATISRIEHVESTAATKTELEQTAGSISTTVSSVKVIAETASTTADTAKTIAESAETTASSAKATAEGAETTANTASATASAAKTTAESANTTAGQAKSTADTANSTANTAKGTADTAKSTADTAKDTADSAKASADDAIDRVTIAETKIEQLPRSVTITATEVTEGGVPKKATIRVGLKDEKGTEISFQADDIVFDGLVTFTNSQIDKVSIGGRNLLANSKDLDGYIIREYLINEAGLRLTDGTAQLYV